MEGLQVEVIRRYNGLRSQGDICAYEDWENRAIFVHMKTGRTGRYLGRWRLGEHCDLWADEDLENRTIIGETERTG